MLAACYGLTVAQLLEKVAAAVSEKEAVFDGYARKTYGELFQDSTNLASGLAQLGVEKGDRVAVCLPNWYEFIALYFAVARLGAILVPFNTRYRQDEVEYILSNSGAKFAFFTRQFSNVPHYEQFKLAKQRVASLEQLISVRFVEEGMLSYDSLIEQGKRMEPPKVELTPKEDVFTILYTSGTTGKPKGAMLTHDNAVHTGTISAEVMECTSEDVFLVAVPVFHVFGMVPSIITAIASQGRMVLMDQYRADHALALIEQEKVTVKHGVPTMFILELNHPQFRSFNLSSLRTGIIAAAPCPVEIVRRIRMEMGCDIVICYGLSETSATLTATDFHDNDTIRAETVGRALPGAEVRIVGHDRRPLATGEIGEIACRGYGVMKGYFNMPEVSSEALDEDGWFYTGDLGTLDEQGYLRMVGRKKELIIRGGYNIYPREIEEVFYTHKSVMEVAIIGLPDSVLGEISCAAIRLKPGENITQEEMKAFVKERVADYKVPDKIIFMEEFPMTASGKIKKVELQIQLNETMGAELR